MKRPLAKLQDPDTSTQGGTAPDSQIKLLKGL